MLSQRLGDTEDIEHTRWSSVDPTPAVDTRRPVCRYLRKQTRMRGPIRDDVEDDPTDPLSLPTKVAPTLRVCRWAFISGTTERDVGTTLSPPLLSVSHDF